MLLDTVAVADISAGEGAGWEGGERLDDLEFITCATEDTAMHIDNSNSATVTPIAGQSNDAHRILTADLGLTDQDEKPSRLKEANEGRGMEATRYRMEDKQRCCCSGTSGIKITDGSSITSSVNLGQQIQDLELRCKAETASRVAAEARAESAEALLVEARARISFLEVALDESSHGFRASCERDDGQRQSSQQVLEKAEELFDPSNFNGVRDATEILLLKASTQVQNLEVLTPGLSVSKPSQGAESDGTADTTINDDDDEDDHTQLNQSQPRNQKLEQLKNITRRSRGFQSRSCHDPVSASSSASTSRASSPHDSDGSGSSSTYCTSPTGTRSTISSSASSSSGRSSFGDDSAPPAINDVPASAGGHIISPIVRTSSSCNSGNNAAHDHGPTATQKCCSSASARVAGSIGVKSSRSGQPPVSSSLATNGGLQTAEVTGISATIVESASLTDGREISGGGHDRLVSTGAVRSNREGGASRKECGTRRGQGTTTSPGKGRKGHGRHHGPDCADGSVCVEVPVGREDEGLLLGGGRVLHKLKEELGGTLEYRRGEGVVLVYGQQSEGGPAKAAACVRTALLLSDGGGGARAEEYAMARLSMDDLLAECIALKGLRQTGGGARGNLNNSWASSSPDPRPSVPPPATLTPKAKLAAATTAAVAIPIPIGGAAAPAVGVAVAATSNIPEGEYPPEPGSLRIIGETFGCVIDVAGEVAAEAAAAVATATGGVATGGSNGGGNRESHHLVRPVGSATRVRPQDVLIWGPSGSVVEAKEAVAALVSGNACSEVVVGAARIKRRDRGFWVNCETMASSVTIEVDHKRGSVWVRGRPEAVEEGRKDFQNKLASLFPGDFLAVPMPRAALKDLANIKDLASAAAEARADHKKKSQAVNSKNDKDGSNVDGLGMIDCADEEGGVELWADWPCSCVRLRGEPASVRCAAKALYASLAEWKALEVSVRVDRAIVTRLLSRSGRILAGISSNMGITLLVEREKGVLRGRARTELDAKEANRVLKLKVNALSLRRPELHPPRTVVPSTAPRSSPILVVSPALSDISEISAGSSSGGSSNGGGSDQDVVEEDIHERELTDPFDELQAFFAGESLPNACSSSTEGKKRSCVFDGVEDVPSISSTTENCSDDGSSSGNSNTRNGKSIAAGTATVVSRGTNRLLQRSSSARLAPVRYAAPSPRTVAQAGASLANPNSSHINHSGDGGESRSTPVSGIFASNIRSLPPPPLPVVHPGLVRAYIHQQDCVYPSPHPRRSSHHMHRPEAFASGGITVESSSSSDVIYPGANTSFRRGSDPGPEPFEHHSNVLPGAAAPHRSCGLSSPPMHPQHQHTSRYPVYQSRRQTVWPVSGSAVSIDQYSNGDGNGGGGGGSMHPGQHVRSRVSPYETAPSANRVEDASHGRHHRQLHHQEIPYSECEEGWGGDGRVEAEAENWAYNPRSQVLSRPGSVRSIMNSHDSYSREEVHHGSYDADAPRDYAVMCGEVDEGSSAFIARGGSVYGESGGGGRVVGHDYEYEIALRQRQVRQMCGNTPVSERCSLPVASRGVGRGSMRGW